MMNYYLGVEGSGEETSLLLFNQVEKIVAQVQAGPTSLAVASVKQVKQNLLTGLNHLFAQAEPEIKQIELAVLGLEGLANDQQEIEIAQQLQAVMTKFHILEFAVIDSSVLALVNGTDRDNALLLKSGNHTVCYGENQLGNELKVIKNSRNLKISELWALVVKVADELKLQNEKFDLILDGEQVARVGVLQYFRQQLQNSSLTAEIVLPHQPAVYGAMKLTLH